MTRNFSDILPIYGIEHDVILSMQGDLTIVYEAVLPELFTLSDKEYEAFHQALIKAIKVLPEHSVFHKQDWFIESAYQPKFEEAEQSFLTRSSERFFNERPYLDHRCYIMLTKKPANRKVSTSFFSTLLRKSIVPEENISFRLLQEFVDTAAQFERILRDSGFVELTRIRQAGLAGTPAQSGLIERYCTLQPSPESRLIRDISFAGGLSIGEEKCQLYTLADAQDLPAYCGSRINYDRYSTDRTKFSIGFASPLCQLLPCSHIYNQYVFINDTRSAIRKLESKRLRLQSLSAYSRENAISRDATNEFLNEAIASQRLPVKAHFNILVWSNDKNKFKEIRNLVSSAFAQMDAVAKQEVEGMPQIFWAGIPGNAGDFPSNETFDTFAEQATCFLNMETSYRSSLSPVGIRLGDRLTGRPVHVDISDEPMKEVSALAGTNLSWARQAAASLFLPTTCCGVIMSRGQT